MVLVTDGNVGVGEGSLKNSLNKYMSKEEDLEGSFPIPFPCKLYVMCVASKEESIFQQSLPHYQKLVDINKGGGEVFVPEPELTSDNVQAMFKQMAHKCFSPFEADLHCGKLDCAVNIFPAPEHYNG